MSTNKDIKEVIIIGSGPAGLTAAIYTARANMKPLIFGGTVYGGQLMTTTEVENFPGFSKGIQGPQLMLEMIKQAERFGAEIIYRNVDKVDFKGKIKKVWVNDQIYQSKSVIIATGASPRMLGLDSEKTLWGKGVSSCATCDGAFYKDKIVSVIGGGDSAMEEANFLTRFAKKVYLIHRKDSFRASEIMQQRVRENEKIEILWNSEVKEILGESTVNGLKLYDNKKNNEYEVQLDGMFLAIGHIPNTSFLNNELEVDELGYIKVKNDTETSINGVFVAGDVKDHRYRQAITAAGMGCMSALDCEKWLEINKF